MRGYESGTRLSSLWNPQTWVGAGLTDVRLEMLRETADGASTPQAIVAGLVPIWCKMSGGIRELRELSGSLNAEDCPARLNGSHNAMRNKDQQRPLRQTQGSSP